MPVLGRPGGAAKGAKSHYRIARLASCRYVSVVPNPVKLDWDWRVVPERLRDRRG